MKSQLQRGLLMAAFISSSFVMLSSANAASACKGLELSACETSQSCGWVNGYTRKDGREVKAFCRAKSKRSVTKSIQKEVTKQVATNK